MVTLSPSFDLYTNVYKVDLTLDTKLEIQEINQQRKV
jgi:hypothetical protein